MATYETLKVVLDANRDALLQRPDVNAVGLGYKHIGGKETGQLAIVISVKEKIPESELDEEHIIPKLIQGCPTDVNVEHVALLKTWKFNIKTNMLSRHENGI